MLLIFLRVISCEEFIVALNSDVPCYANNSISHYQPLECYYDDPTFLQSSNITMIFMNGSYEGNRTDTIFLQEIKIFHLIGKGATTISSLNLVLNSYYFYEPIEIRQVNLTNSYFTFNTDTNISHAHFLKSSIRVSVNDGYSAVLICNSTFQSTNITVSYGTIYLSGFVKFYTFGSNVTLLNGTTIKIGDNANITFCKNYTCKEAGDITWDAQNLWLHINKTKNGNYSEIKLSDSCPLGKCLKQSTKTLDNQCSEYHTGDLCGSCTDSLGIGYSGCLECSNNNNLALLILFAAAGPLLIIVISILNLTVTQGVINGVIFYANIVWVYKSFFLQISDNSRFYYYYYYYYNPLYVILAWLNLDFGVPTCFAHGLTAPVKHFLEFLFPFYIATLFFVGLRFSDKLSKLLGSRSVPTLATLLFLSYTKLFRTIITCFQLATYELHQPNKETEIIHVWAIDGKPFYGFKEPHFYLFVFAVVLLVVLWIPYTFLLLLMQCLRKIDHYRALRFIGRYKPFYDAHFGPLNDRHHYWFGLLLLVRGLLLLISSFTLHKALELNIYLLLVVMLFLLCYLNIARVYKKRLVMTFESLFLANLILFIVIQLQYYKDQMYGQICGQIVGTSFVSFAVLKILIIVIMNIVLSIRSCRKARRKNLHREKHNKQSNVEVELTANARFRDSILEEPLLADS